MNSAKAHALASMTIPTPVRVGRKWMLVGNGASSEVPGPVLDANDPRTRAAVRRYILRSFRVILNVTPDVSVSPTVEDIAPGLYKAWWERPK